MFGLYHKEEIVDIHTILLLASGVAAVFYGVQIINHYSDYNEMGQKTSDRTRINFRNLLITVVAVLIFLALIRGGTAQ